MNSRPGVGGEEEESNISSPSGVEGDSPLSSPVPVGIGLHFEKPPRRPKINRATQPLPWASLSDQALDLFSELNQKAVADETPAEESVVEIEPVNEPTKECKEKRKRKREPRKKEEEIPQRDEAIHQNDHMPTDDRQLTESNKNASNETRAYTVPYTDNDSYYNHNNDVPKVSSLWNADTGLSIWERCRVCVEMWEAHAAIEIHPAITDEANLREVLSNPSAVTPLSFHLYIGMVAGAWAADDSELQRECVERATQQAGELFDQPDLTTASALLLLSGYYSFVCSPQRGSYYATLAATMCEHGGYTNTEVYMRALSYGLVFKQSVGSIRRFHLKVQGAQQASYNYLVGSYDAPQDTTTPTTAPTTTTTTTPLPTTTTETTTTTQISSFPPLLTESTPEGMLQYHIKLFYMLFIALALARSPDDLALELLHSLVKRLKKMFQEWLWVTENVEPSLAVKPSRGLTVKLLFITTIVDIYRRLGNYTKALHWASLGIHCALHPSFLSLPSHSVITLSLLQTFSESESTYWQLEALVNILAKIKYKHPLLVTLLDPFERLLAAASNRSPQQQRPTNLPQLTHNILILDVDK